MATSQIEVETRVTELATQALKAFCEDVSGTFGVDMECQQQAVAVETVEGLKKRFNKLLAVNIVDSEGLLGGTFQFIFDQEGLFTLGGIIVMLPEERIMSNRQNASPGLAESMVDAMGETGNLLVGSLDRIFSEGLEGHNHFSHRLPAFVGKPWDKSEETIGLAGDEEVFFIPYEITVGSYPAFNCGVIFPKTIFGESSDLEPEETAMVEQDTQEETEENTPEMQTAADSTDSEESDKESDTVEGNEGEESKQEQPSVEETPADTTDAGEVEEQAQTGQAPEDTADSENAAAEHSNSEESQLREPDVSSDQEDTAPDPNAANDVAEDTAVALETSEEPAMAKNATPSVIGNVFEIRANDIMQNKVTWASPDDSLQQALAKMQQTDAGYIMIGRNGVLEGIVSKSDITRAISPYLQPIFAKWRRSLDDATLKIRIKWIMSRPVHIIKPETLLAAIMEHMSQFRGRCLPVTDEQGNVQGLVTTFDIFQTLLQSNSNTCSEGQTAQALVESAAPAGTT
jgi:CBS domain-containing protein